jgi:hypothetical protein
MSRRGTQSAASERRLRSVRAGQRMSWWAAGDGPEAEHARADDDSSTATVAVVTRSVIADLRHSPEVRSVTGPAPHRNHLRRGQPPDLSNPSGRPIVDVGGLRRTDAGFRGCGRDVRVAWRSGRPAFGGRPAVGLSSPCY